MRRNRSTDPIGSWIVIQDNTGDAATSYTDDTAEASVRYRYRVKARNAHGLSRRSPFAVVETPDAPSEPVVENRDENGVSIPPIPDDTPMTLESATLESATLESATLESDDFADSTATTGTVSVAGSARGDIETEGDRDWFAVSLVAGTDYLIDLKGTPTYRGTLRDPYLRGVHDSDGDLIDRTDDGDGDGAGDYNNLNSRVEYGAGGNNGVIYIEVGGVDSTGTYTLSVTLIPNQTTCHGGHCS